MTGMYILDENGNAVPCTDTLEWAKWIEDKSHMIVLQDYVGDIWVSTVFLGLDYGWGDNLALFETMVFYKDRTELHCERYATKVEAVDGHMKVIARVLSGEIHA